MKSITPKLFTSSILSLFAELVLIRYLGTEIPSIGFFKNLILIGAFLGLGIGFCLKYPIRRSYYGYVTTFAMPFFMVLLMQFLGSPDLYTNPKLPGEAGLFTPSLSVSLAIITLCIFFLSAVLPFIFLGSIIGRYFDEFKEPLKAYGINLFGSIMGTALFSIICFFSSPPAVWMSIITILMLILLLLELKQIGKCCFLISFGFSLLPIFFTTSFWEKCETFWTPYYKITLQSTVRPDGRFLGYRLNVNNTWYQKSIDVYEKLDYAKDKQYARELRFVVPFRIAEPKNVLVLGSGLGNDVAAALRFKVDHVTAVDIDPDIIRISEQFHPNKPYLDPNVDIVTDDARHFLTVSQEKYDLIVFGVLEARSLFSQFSNLRLDNYVYTVEGLDQARSLLSPNGFLVLNVWIPESWVLIKFKKLAETVFGTAGLLLKSKGSNHYSLVFCKNSQYENVLSILQEFRTVIVLSNSELSTEDVTVPTDDWPYIFYRERSLPVPYIGLLGILILLSILPLRLVHKDFLNLNWAFFFMGAAFLLIETNAVVRMALLAGTTWIVNASVFAAILIFTFIANYLIMKYNFKNINLFFSCLGISLLFSILFPFSVLLTLPNYLAIVTGALILTAPVIFSGLIFSYYFKKVPILSKAIGSNLLGVVFGGFGEYLSLLVGNRAIVIVALVCYVGAFLAFRKQR